MCYKNVSYSNISIPLSMIMRMDIVGKVRACNYGTVKLRIEAGGSRPLVRIEAGSRIHAGSRLEAGSINSFKYGQTPNTLLTRLRVTRIPVFLFPKILNRVQETRSLLFAVMWPDIILYTVSNYRLLICCVTRCRCERIPHPSD